MLKQKILNKTAILGVIGLGYVGLSLAYEKAKAGYLVVCFDVQPHKVNMVNAGINYIGDIINEDFIAIMKSGKLMATSDFSCIANIDCVSICVPTPLDKYRQPDIGYVKSSVETVAKYLHKDMLVLLESTTYPDITHELVKPILEATGLICGQDFYLAFSPERIDPSNLMHKTKNTPKVVCGVTYNCTEIAVAMYEAILEEPVIAEMGKYYDKVL